MNFNSYMLQEVCEFIDYRGKTPVKTKTGVPLVTAKIIKNGVIMSPQEFIAEDSYNEWMRRGIPKKGDVIFTTEAPLGEVAEIRTNEKLAFAQRVIIMEPKNQYLNNHYLLYALQDKKLKNRIAAKASGTTVIGIKSAELKKIVIDLPSIEIQERIADILYSLDEKIALNVAINNNLQQQLHLLFVQIFDNIDMDVTLGDVVGTTSGGTPSRKHNEYYDGGYICWVKSKELSGSYIHNTEEHINDLAIAKSAAKLLPAHSVLIAMYGATVGAYGIISKPMACNQAVCALLGNEKYPYTYLFQIACESQQKFINLAVGSAQQNISQVLIKQLPVHSDVDNIQRFHSLAKSMHEDMELLQAENRCLSELRDSLLTQLMSGELDVSDIHV